MRTHLLHTAGDRTVDVIRTAGEVSADVLRSAGDLSGDILRSAGDRTVDVLRSAGDLSAEVLATAEHTARDVAGHVAEVGGTVGGAALGTIAELPRKVRRVPIWALVLIAVTLGAALFVLARRRRGREHEQAPSSNGQSPAGPGQTPARAPASASNR